MQKATKRRGLSSAGGKSAPLSGRWRAPAGLNGGSRIVVQCSLNAGGTGCPSVSCGHGPLTVALKSLSPPLAAGNIMAARGQTNSRMHTHARTHVHARTHARTLAHTPDNCYSRA